MSIKALIPVRSGSLRVQNKNIRPFANSNLLEIKIKQLQRIKQLDGIIVNSNDDEMLDIARALGAETVKRDDYFASNTVSINEVYVDLLQNFNADDVLFADVTNPLIKDSTVEQAIANYYKNIDCFDSCNTVNAVKMFLWQDGKTINYDVNAKPRSQDLPNIVAINSAINVISKATMLSTKDFIGRRPDFLEVSAIEGLDIDNPIDFEFAEFMYRKYIIECSSDAY